MSNRRKSSTKKVATCATCDEKILPGQGTALCDCGTTVHRGCLESHAVRCARERRRAEFARTLPTITGPVSVSFKHESEVGGLAVGPVVVTAREPYEAWLKVHGIPHTNSLGQVRYLYPFGAKPDGLHVLAWMPKHHARDVAAHYGVTLEEV